MQNRVLDMMLYELDDTYDVSEKFQIIYENFDWLSLKEKEFILDLYLTDCIQDPACTTSHLVQGFTKFASAIKMEQYTTLCLKQAIFPHDRETYFQLAGVSFFNTIYDYFSRLQYELPVLLPVPKQIHNMEELFALIFNHYQEMLNGDELHQLSTLLISVHSYFRKSLSINDSVKCNALLQNALLLIANHPAYQYLPEFLPSSSNPNLFTFSATYGCKEIFFKFYSHEDIPASEKKEAIQLLKVFKHENMLRNIADDLYQSFYKEVVVTFLLSNNLLNNDIRKYIINIFAQAAHQEYLDCLLGTNEPPKIYQDKHFLPTLFQKQPITPEWLILRTTIKSRDYLSRAHFSRRKIDKGIIRARSFIDIFENTNLSTGFKMMAIYALMHEKSNLLGKLEIQKCIEPAIEPYLVFIKNAAVDYANAYKKDLDSLADNLVAHIHNGTYCTNFLTKIEENVFLKAIDDNQNCLIM